MTDFSACSCRDGIEGTYLLLSKLTFSRDERPESPFSLLGAYMDALNCGDLLQACRCYHALTAALLSAPSRRVSGDLWLDYLLWLVVEAEHLFAVYAAQKRRDDYVVTAMHLELNTLYELSKLSDVALKRFAQERYRELKLKPRSSRDSIELMSTALWSGNAAKPQPKEEKPAVTPASPIQMDFDWAPWHYGEMSLTGQYVSDEALEEIYIRLLNAKPWPHLIDDLWNFFAAYGCGGFLRSRAFQYERGGMFPLSENVLSPLPTARLYEQQRGVLLENTIRFMQGARCNNLVLTGASGTGKTTQVLSLPYELPEVRFIAVDAAGCLSLTPLFERLSAQPLKFLVLLDNIDFSSPCAGSLMTSLLALRAQPENVLLYATALSGAGGESVFPVTVHFPYPQLKEFVELVTEILEQDNVRAPYDVVRNACIDYQVDAHDRLTYAAAVRVAEAVKQEL